MRTPSETTSVFDSPLKARARKAVIGGLARLGFGLEPLDDSAHYVADDTTKLAEMVSRFAPIPGMIPLRRCVHLYLLAFANGVRGDIIEIGSWQGRSTAFLAQACADTDNGVVHAIDTFQGNPGSEHNYEIDGSLRSLEASFRQNMERTGVGDRVVTHAKFSADAIEEVRSATRGVRMLFIDGEHTYEAVKSDLANYAELVAPGGLIVFDDYSPGFEGDVRAVHEHVAAHPKRYGTGFQQKNTLVLPVRG